ncbi:hypothetical protein ACKN8S_07970 [Limosilactobacillus reuteri]|uniref:hypothetical protein n=1 Tax=Limosilactobacillus reuteri TaxID=1598 RepID=UPI0039BED893
MDEKALDGELALIEAIMFGVVQVKLIPSNKRLKLFIPSDRKYEVGKIYSISNDHQYLM